MFGGPATGKSFAFQQVLKLLQPELLEEDIVKADKDTLLMGLPQMECMVERNLTECAPQMISECRPVARDMQTHLVVEALNVRRDVYLESTNSEKLQDVMQNQITIHLRHPIDFVFVLTMVEDMDSVISAQKERANKTGRSVPEDVVRNKVKDRELDYLVQVQNMRELQGKQHNKHLKHGRDQFFVQRRCTATSSGNVVEVTQSQMDSMLAKLAGYRGNQNASFAREVMWQELKWTPCPVDRPNPAEGTWGIAAEIRKDSFAKGEGTVDSVAQIKGTVDNLTSWQAMKKKMKKNKKQKHRSDRINTAATERHGLFGK